MKTLRIAFSTVALLGPLAMAQSHATSLSVKVSAAKGEFLLGEPVLLSVAVQNQGRSALELDKPMVDGPFEPDIVIQISRDGRRFETYQSGVYQGVGKVIRKRETLRPGEQWAFVVKLLYQESSPSGLALSEPGEYWIRVVYPEFSSGGRLDRVSDAVRIRVTHPDRVDAKVWQALKVRARLYFLHTGQPPRSQVQDSSIGQLTGLIEQWPGSGYDAAIREALRIYLNSAQYVLPPVQKSKLRRVLHPESPGLFMDDRRLDIVVDAGCEATPLSRLLSQLGAAGGVQLSAEDELGKRETSSLPRRMELRAVLQELAKVTSGKWERTGNGYLLVRGATAPRSAFVPMFPDDRRLDALVHAGVRGDRLETVLESLRRQSGVVLQPGDVFHSPWSGFGTGSLPSDLRSVMSFMSQYYNATWFPTGKGYVLRHNIPPSKRVPNKIDVIK